ncbi:MAG: hypothetical protein IJ282_05105 [Lachnospiraceae bacterium]|nr:hypothetical protein [Lachnospiraceae bacterium]
MRIDCISKKVEKGILFWLGVLVVIASLPALRGIGASFGYRVYSILINLVTVAVSYYCFSGIFDRPYIGLACSWLYTLSIYRIYKLFVVFAAWETCAMVFFPIIAYGLYKMFTDNVKEKSYKFVWVFLGIGYAGVLITDLVSFEVIAVLTLLLCIFCFRKVFVKETLWELIKGCISALVMSLAYILPFWDNFFERNLQAYYLPAGTIQDKGLYFPQLVFHWWKNGDNGLFGDAGMQSSQPVGVGLVLALSFAAFCILWYAGELRDKEKSVLSLGKTAAVFGGLLMFMSMNIFPWDSLQHLSGLTTVVISAVQFPGRFLGWGILWLVILAGCLLWFFKEKAAKWYYYVSVVIVMISITTSSMYLLDFISSGL